MIKLSDISIVAFDCDGVLFDTEAANRAYYNTILSLMGMPEMTEEQFFYAQMHTVDAALEFLCGRENLERAHYYRRQSGYLPFIKHMKKAPFLEDLLNRLNGHCHTAIATNRSNTMNRVLEEHGLAGRFELVVTALDVMRPKPAPEQLLKILDHFQASPAAMIYIGDSELDQAAAASAEVPFIAFNNSALAADFHVTDMRQLGTVLGLDG
ncbi:MAG: HAD hydrolase-like protein [Desulfosudaceae bacterium]